MFTAPLAGRYLLSAVLTGHRHEKVEAVLSRSNLGVARIDSGGYEPEGLENKPVAESQPSPGALPRPASWASHPPGEETEAQTRQEAPVTGL